MSEECEGLKPRQFRKWHQGWSREVKEQPSRHPDNWTQCHHHPLWMAVSSSCPTAWPWFSDATHRRWRQSHLPMTSPGFQSQTTVSCRKTRDSFNKAIFPGFCWKHAAPPTGFSGPLYAICKPVKERPERGLYISSSHIFCSPYWRAKSIPNSQERKYDWPILGWCPSFFWKEII